MWSASSSPCPRGFQISYITPKYIKFSARRRRKKIRFEDCFEEICCRFQRKNTAHCQLAWLIPFRASFELNFMIWSCKLFSSARIKANIHQKQTHIYVFEVQNFEKFGVIYLGVLYIGSPTWYTARAKSDADHIYECVRPILWNSTDTYPVPLQNSIRPAPIPLGK